MWVCVGEAPGNWPILSRDREEEEEEEGREKEVRGKREKRGGGGPTTASEGGKEREEGFTSSNCSSSLWAGARNLLGCVLECGLWGDGVHARCFSRAREPDEGVP